MCRRRRIRRRTAGRAGSPRARRRPAAIEKIAHAAAGSVRREAARQFLAFGMHGDRQPKTRRLTQSVEQRCIVGAWKLGQARVAHERLETDHATVGHCRHLADTTGNEAAPQREIGDRRSLERARLRSNSSTFTVHGVELSGMSKNSVPPPAASAPLPVAAPSHSVRPGSLKCTCTSMRPGSTNSPSRVNLVAAAGQRRTDRSDAAGVDATSAPLASARRDHDAAAHDDIDHREPPPRSSSSAVPTPAPRRHHPRGQIHRDGG